jgi:hypothetical protein
MVFDLGRALALTWALFTTCRRRAWMESALLAMTVYVVALEVASGFTIRSVGPLPPMYSMLLIFIGPSGMPRGPLPPFWPGAGAIVAWPGLVDAIVAVALAAAATRLVVRGQRLPDASDEGSRLRTVSKPLVFVALVQAISVASRLLPGMLGGEM